MSGAAPVSRNAPCPCGSGLRYKECHGLLAQPAPASPLDRALQARERARAGDFEGAAAASEEVLREAAEHPTALEVLALGETEAGRPLTALRLLLRAARGLSVHALPPAAAYSVWTALNGAFLDALTGLDADAAGARRDAYRRAQAARRGTGPAREVAVILVVRDEVDDEAVAATLDSITAQSRPPAELLVACGADRAFAPAVQQRLASLPFPVRRIDVAANDSIAPALDAGVTAARAPYVVALDPPHAFAPSHLETLIDALAEHGARWGFAGCEPFAHGAAGPEALAAFATVNDATRTTLARADSLGMAFLDQTFAAGGLGAVAFARALHAELGGFRGLPGHEMWDFTVRALWLDEPVHVAAPTYRHAVTARPAQSTVVQRETAQREMYRGYYALACQPDAVSPNPFAPSLANWDLQFLRRLFKCGHVLMVNLDTLDVFAERIAAAHAQAPTAPLTPGINLLGFAFGEFGLGESLRALARACEAGGIPFVVKDVEQTLATRQADRSVAHHLSDDLRHRLSLMCLNPDLLKSVRTPLERTRAAGGRGVGYWYWELETVPRTWEPAYGSVDEVWCATGFVAAAVRRATDLPVIKIPPPMEVALARRFERAEFGLPDGAFLFLFTFDYNSFVKRKNPEAAIAAFRAAFPRGRSDVGLVVKSVNGSRRPERVAAIMAAIGGDPRVVHLDRFLSREEVYGLTAVTDAYVSLHRAEGLGLGLAEAMALGRPVIGTGYSGNLEFMDEGNSLLVDYRLVPVAPGDYLVDDDRFVWAEPDVEAAARHMRALADDAALRARLAEAGRTTIATRFTRERAGRLIRQRLVELGMLEPAGDARAARAAAGPQAATAGEAFVSYAQNGEDALLARVLRGVEGGRYIDVGANDPEVHSVTRAFYERGWSGVNVEPVAEWHARLVQARPRDVNLQAVATRQRGTAKLFEFAGTGLSTLDPGIAQRHARAGRTVVEREVPALPLREIAEAHAGGEVHFLKIDVEGAEADVLAGADFERHRPWVVVIEATAPLTGIPSHDAWEPRLLAAGYRFACDDGLNRYYVAAERAELIPRFTDPGGPPVITAAAVIAASSDLPSEQRYDPRAASFLDLDAPEPTLARPGSQLCTARQFAEPVYREWCRALRDPPALRRKQWEHVWILQCLAHAGLLEAGRRGLGFGCGREPLAAAMAARGCTIVATDLDAGVAAGRGWIETGQHALRLDDLNEHGLCPPERFRERVRFRAQDMNAIDEDLAGFDFVWSSCALEHLGSLERGSTFVQRAMRCLRPGGLAVHTTEFNLSSNGSTVESENLSVYRRRDIERLAGELGAAGHRVWPLNLQPGTGPVDRHVDVPPYRAEPHLKLRLEHTRYVITSIGLVIERGP